MRHVAFAARAPLARAAEDGIRSRRSAVHRARRLAEHVTQGTRDALSTCVERGPDTPRRSHFLGRLDEHDIRPRRDLEQLVEADGDTHAAAAAISRRDHVAATRCHSTPQLLCDNPGRRDVDDDPAGGILRQVRGRSAHPIDDRPPPAGVHHLQQVRVDLALGGRSRVLLTFNRVDLCDYLRAERRSGLLRPCAARGTAQRHCQDQTSAQTCPDCESVTRHAKSPCVVLPVLVVRPVLAVARL